MTYINSYIENSGININKTKRIKQVFVNLTFRIVTI
jgi:hypothetical protein